jgi:aryl-alcohol dehydrogenase-like predicted oxidoreductase
MPDSAATSLPTPGWATADGTSRYRARIAAAAGHFRHRLDVDVSSIGVGTYLGGHDSATDAAYAVAIAAALESGANVIDTAINYRFQRSERTIGRMLADMFSRDVIRRDEVVICTKGGYLAFDDAPPADARGWVQQTFVEPGIIRWEDIISHNVMQPAYIRHQLETSRQNLGLDTIDVYYLHNPESQLERLDRSTFRDRMRTCFEELERAAADGKIRYYGTATWNGYRVPPDDPAHLSLAELESVAQAVGGPDHRFRAVQLPFNLAMPEAFVAENQRVDGHMVNLLEAARRCDTTVFASASLLQAKLTALPAEIRPRIPGLETDAQRALQFVRSTPFVTTALVGMSRIEHVRENLRLARVPLLAPDAYATLYT